MSYGTEIRNGSAAVRLTADDFLDTIYARGTATLSFVSANSRFEVFVSVSGMSNNGLWAVSLFGGDVRYGVESGGFRAIASDAFTFSYLVLRRGSV